MTFSARVTALTQDVILPKVVDSVLGSNVLVARLMGNAKKWKGETLRIPVKVSNSGTASSFAGLDTFTAAVFDTKQRLSFDVRGVRQPIALSGMEVAVNKITESQVIDMVKEAFEEGQQELIDEIGDQVYGDGTGNTNKDLLGLGAAVDDGTDVVTYGGLSRTTFPVLNATRTASGGTLTLARLATLYSAVSSGSMSGTTPTIIISNETVFDLYEQLLTPTLRHSYQETGMPLVGMKGGLTTREGLVGKHGFVALSYKGIPWVRDEKSTAQTVWMLNENYLHWYGVDVKGTFGYNSVSLSSGTIDGVYDKAPMDNFSGFGWSGFRAPTNQFGGIGDLILMGNIVSGQPRRHGRLTGVTTV
ncbi:MAG: phage major capsid protein [Candidatus Eisenbacteria bacterium]|nr:phage major capsid protein [Candidatus Eisenbacteria bacterium]